MSGPEWRRTHTCGELDLGAVGQFVRLNGWVHVRRDLGGIYFVDLRDRYGLTQLVLEESLTDAVRLSAEDVVMVEGTVRERTAKNPELPTGEIEIEVTKLEILSKAETPPMEVAAVDVPSVETRLRYRFLDLRRAPMQRSIAHRAKLISAIRRGFDGEGFLDIETPILTKATPEGARDYLVPSRVHPGSFYALPQSPQIFKQILMCSGFDKYYQVARCFRDEDLRADRQPDFTQLDMEMSFVEEEDVFAVWERVLVQVFHDVMGVELPAQFPRLTWLEAMERFGTDKPDTRFGMEIQNVDAWAGDSDFQVFRGTIERGDTVRALVVAGGADLSRKVVDGLAEFVRPFGAKGLAWWKWTAEGGAGPLARFTEGAAGDALRAALGMREGDLALFVADTVPVARRALGELRLHLAKLREVPRTGWNFLWITAFPMFEYDEESGRYVSSHHPFTAPASWDLAEADHATLASRAYDLVLNGWEMGSGSIRIHRTDVQRRVFDLLGIGPEEQEAKFGFLLEALRYGAPPHGGFALGLDRIAALTAGLDNIRDVIAFPKTATAADLMCGAPAPVTSQQLRDVHVQLAPDALERLRGADESA
ncbi:MAG: aspartate--tRNA ligase [Planctomycetota bacterium]